MSLAARHPRLHRLSLWLVPRLYSLLTRLLLATCRVEFPDRERCKALVFGPPCIFAFWHYSLVYVIHLARKGRWVAMVSGSGDGEYVARILEHQGTRTVRGSSGRGGARALRRMLRLIGVDGNGAIVADGSRGPALVLQGGAVMMAARLAVPVVPIAWAADRYWTVSSWDRTVIPKPFSRIRVRCGEPFSVPEKAGREELEECRKRLEAEMLALYREVWGAFGRERH